MLFRHSALHGATSLEGRGNVLSELVGITSNTAPSAGVSVCPCPTISRSIRKWCCAVFLAMAFLPKMLTLVLSNTVFMTTARLGTQLATRFVIDTKITIEDRFRCSHGLKSRDSFWIEASIRNDLAYPDYVSEIAGCLMHNGASDGIVNRNVTAFIEFACSASLFDDTTNVVIVSKRESGATDVPTETAANAA